LSPGAGSDLVQPLHEGAFVLPLRTPTLPPATHTNTLVVGGSRLAIIEPATPHADERARLDAFLAGLAAQGRRVVAILVTHHHVDHIGYVESLRETWSVPVYAHAATAARVPFDVDVCLGPDEVLDLSEGYALQAVFTPGHAPGHHVYLETKSRVAHGGDLVAGQGTILIDPEDDGDMAAYLQSLARLRALPIGRLVPAHGPVIDDVHGIVDHYIAHRLQREAKVLAAIAAAPTAWDDVLAAAYDDVPRMVWPLAARSLEAHVRKLVDEGLVQRDDGRLWRVG
jgi:glyoxylase-like metal-dependent hydrolase (beta-lactamase superfamily II)